jgi:hypothetical protein
VKLLEKARAKKAQPDNKVDVLSQLEVGEGEKKKWKASDARISIPVRASSAGDLAAGKAIEVGGRHKLNPLLRRSRGP